MKSKVYQPQVFRCGVVANLPPIVRRFGTALQVRAQDFDAYEAITRIGSQVYNLEGDMYHHRRNCYRRRE